MLKSLGERVAAAKTADPAELEQSRIRFYIVAAFGCGYLLAAYWDGILDAGERINVAALIVMVALDAAHLGWILLRPGVNQRRRRTAVWMDMAATSWCMVRTDEMAVMF